MEVSIIGLQRCLWPSHPNYHAIVAAVLLPSDLIPNVRCNYFILIVINKFCAYHNILSVSTDNRSLNNARGIQLTIFFRGSLFVWVRQTRKITFVLIIRVLAVEFWIALTDLPLPRVLCLKSFGVCNDRELISRAFKSVFPIIIYTINQRTSGKNIITITKI